MFQFSHYWIQQLCARLLNNIPCMDRNPFHSSVPPQITDGPDNVTVMEGEDAVFICEATAQPRPQITWWMTQDDGSSVIIGSGDSKYSVIERESGRAGFESILTVLGTTPTDDGIYICRAVNPTEVSAVAQASLTVIGNDLCPTAIAMANSTFLCVCPFLVTYIQHSSNCPVPDTLLQRQ